MTRTNWERLYEIAEARRNKLAMHQDELRDYGGPSASGFRAIKDRSGRPTPKMRDGLLGLDASMGWPGGTSWRIASDPFEDGSPAAEDEESRLVEGDETTWIPSKRNAAAIRTFEKVILPRLRRMDEASAERAMAEMVRLLGIG